MRSLALVSQFGDAVEYVFVGGESVTGGLRVGGTELLGLTGRHMLISVLALAAAAAVCVPLGLYLGHHGRGGVLAINVSNVGRAVPPLALMGLFIAFLGIGMLNMTVVLALLALPAILTNTYVGIRQVDRDTVDAARGMGLTEGQIVRRVELPLALSTIFGGVRTSAVIVVATAVIAPLGSVDTLGTPIINENVHGPAGQLGASMVIAALTLVTDAGLGLVQRAVTPRGVKLTVPEPARGRGPGKLIPAILRRRAQPT
ncbi:MAG: ABC transporter permease [Actinomycetota bacterium]|nr:ABC transporter permease [Actinomycetota bacterium]